jgi:hypothetical protein
LASSTFLQLNYCGAMVLQEAARVLCQFDQAQSLHRRAITLFGFQVAVLSPSIPVLESKARVLAALKILEGMESDVAFGAGLQERLGIVGYRELLDLIMREGGARTLRSMWSTNEVWDHVNRSLKEAKDVAHMVQFSHRFANFGKPKPRQKGGPTMARRFVSETIGPSDGTLKRKWREYGATAVLQYLMLFHYKRLRPKKLSGKSFVKRLFQQAGDVEELEDWEGSSMRCGLAASRNIWSCRIGSPRNSSSLRAADRSAAVQVQI